MNTQEKILMVNTLMREIASELEDLSKQDFAKEKVSIPRRLVVAKSEFERLSKNYNNFADDTIQVIEYAKSIL